MIEEWVRKVRATRNLLWRLLLNLEPQFFWWQCKLQSFVFCFFVFFNLFLTFFIIYCEGLSLSNWTRHTEKTDPKNAFFSSPSLRTLVNFILTLEREVHKSLLKMVAFVHEKKKGFR